jgi:hypothetical protein
MSTLLGYAVLCRYPLNISRLRTRLENIVHGKFDEDVGLMKGMADIPAIEQALRILVEQLRRRVENVENEIDRAESLLSRSAMDAIVSHHDETLAKRVYHHASEANEEAIVETRAQHEGFILLLFEIIPDAGGSVEQIENKFKQGFKKLQELQNLVRSSDQVMARGANRVVMVAKAAPAQLAGLYRRWETQVSLCFHDVDPQLDVRLECGYAEYPKDGSSAEELLSRAERTISPFEKLAIVKGVAAGSLDLTPPS